MQNQTTHTDLFLDIQLRPRDTENSRIVVKRWGENADPYSTTIPNAQPGEEQALKAFFAITAERLLYRSKVLALPIDNDFAASEVLQCARPFGQDGPNFASLYVPSVSTAMAFIPLTPEGDSGKPVLARLYCVKGLAFSYPPPFADGADLSALARYSWFLAGLPDKLADEPVNGRSWLLAAHLLMEVVGKNATASTKKNLATGFIVSGDVLNGNIRPVEMGRKPELATIKEYRNLKWIIPMKNTNDMNNVPFRLVEKPATLEEAYELIESMQSRATKSFFRFLKAADIDGMKEQHANGADLFTADEATGKTPLQLIEEDIAKAQSLPIVDEKGKSNVERQNSLNRLLPVRDWLKGAGADCTMMIYNLAKSRMLDVLDRCLQKFPINARDERGLTAVDWAIIAGDWETANLIHSLGGVCDKRAKNNTALRNLVDGIDRPWVAERNGECKGVPAKTREKAILALKCGLDADTGDLFSKFIKIGDIEVVELALQLGRNPNNELSPLDFGESLMPIFAVAEDKSGLLGEETQKSLIDLLFKYGATKGLETAQHLQHALARGYVHKALHNHLQYTKRIGEMLAEGSLTFDEEFPIGIHSDPEDELYDGEVVSGSLFVLALNRGWKDVIKKCLEKGASPAEEIETTYPRYEGGSYIETRSTPTEYVMKCRRMSTETKQQILSLLQSYLSPDPLIDIPF